MGERARLAQRCRRAGIVLAVVGVLWTVFGFDLYFALTGAPINNLAMYALNAAGKALQFFGLPFAAVLIGVSILLKERPLDEDESVYPPPARD